MLSLREFQYKHLTLAAGIVPEIAAGEMALEQVRSA